MTKQPIRIVFLTNSLHPAGAENFLLGHLRCLDRERYEPIVCRMKEEGELSESFSKIAVEVISLKQQFKLQPKALFRLWRLLRRRQIDILQTHVYYSCIVGRIIGKLARVPVIVSTEQDVRMGAQSRSFLKRLLNDATMALSDANVFISEAVAQSFHTARSPFLRFGPVQRIIPNGICFEEFEADIPKRKKDMRKMLGLSSENFVIGHVGRLEAQKGQSYLIHAFSEVLPRCPDAVLVIVGWGSLEEALRNLTRRLGLEDKVIFLGKRMDIQMILPGFDVFCYPSIFEAQGIAILEAMAAGVPVIASDVGGIGEMVKHEETGLLFKPHDVDGIRNSILGIFNNRERGRQLAENAKSFVREKYSIRAASKAYDAIYEPLFAMKKPAAPGGRSAHGETG